LRFLLAALLAALAFYLPWLIYALPKLAVYVSDKVPADADQPLDLLNYLLRHWLAFTAGHLATDNPLLRIPYWAGIIAGALLLVTTLYNSWRRATRPLPSTSHPLPVAPHTLLWICLLLPLLSGFALNRWAPFFPIGGERLLLMILPYFLLLMAQEIAAAWSRPYLGRVALAGMLLSAGAGVWIFYTTPRYGEHDYRPLIRQIVQQGNDAGAILAIFPWEVGYWRTYAVAEACQFDHGYCTARGGLEPQSGPSITLNDIDQALAKGVLWFAAPLSFGSTLPLEIEDYLSAHAVNLENRWVSTATRLSAWQLPKQLALAEQTADFGAAQLTGAGISPAAIASANHPVQIALAWQFHEKPANLGVSLRLQDQTGRVWASRNYAPLGSLTGVTGAAAVIDRAGLIIPAGLPPALYELMLGIVVSETQALLPPISQTAQAKPLVSLGSVEVTRPTPAPPPFRLPIQRFAVAPLPGAGFRLLGYAGNTVGATLLAGEAVNLTLFLQAQTPVAPDARLRVVLLDTQAAPIVEGEIWSPAVWSGDGWTHGDLVQAPIQFFAPATLPNGAYRIGLETLGPDNIPQHKPAIIGQVHFHQRPLQLAAPVMATTLTPPVQFGTHALLIGYDLLHEDGSLTLALHWHVLQTLLPPHHIFVHLDTIDGALLAQSESIPMTKEGAAPTGTWRPNEFLTTHNHVAASPSLAVAQLRVGLYVPETGVRLPAIRAGQPIGDAVILTLRR
jgi:hypothetical protein